MHYMASEATKKKIDELLTRSIASVLPSKDALQSLLLSGKKLRIYIGADATGPDLHLGHSTNYLLLEEFRKLGHETIVLFGDFTAMIGDPSDKDAARKPLSSREVENNIRTWKSQLAPIMKLGGFRGSKTVKNSLWLSKLSFEAVMKLSSIFTVQQMIERDMFNKRMKENKPIHLHEFLYPLMQGYDSVALDVDVEIGGNDQTFNMLTGRILQRKYNNKEKFVIATTLLENPDTGKKLMSKSEGNYVGLNDDPKNMFGKIMALPDSAIRQMFVDCTRLPISIIDKILGANPNPRDQKLSLAKEIVSMYHGVKEAEKAEKYFTSVFSDKKIPNDMPEYTRTGNESYLPDAFLSAGMIQSKTEFITLMRQGAITNLDTGEKITGIHPEVRPGNYKIGSHRFLRII